MSDRVDDHGPPDPSPPDRVLLPTLETPTLTKAELADLLFEQLGLNKRESKDMVEAFFDLISRRCSCAATTSRCRASATSSIRAQGAAARAATRAPARRSRSRRAAS